MPQLKANKLADYKCRFASTQKTFAFISVLFAILFVDRDAVGHSSTPHQHYNCYEHDGRLHHILERRRVCSHS